MAQTMPWPEFVPGEAPLGELVKLSRFFGSNPDFVIAGGGNTSVKVGESLLVKPSGVALAAIAADDFVELSRGALDALLVEELGGEPGLREERFKEAILAARVDPQRGRRPSVECVLHNLLPRRFVVHTHATRVNWLTCAVGGEAAALRLFGDEALWVPYVDPGYVLARSVAAALRDYARRTGRPCPQALLMQNHGLIVCGDTPDEVRSVTDRLAGAIAKAVGPAAGSGSFGAAAQIEPRRARVLIDAIAPTLRALLADEDALRVVTFDDSPTILGYAGSDEGRAFARGGPFTPDQIVYCNSFPLLFDAGAAGEPEEALLERLAGAVRSHTRETGFPPLVVLVPGVGMFTSGRDFAAADTVRLCYLDAVRVAAGARSFGGARPLPSRDRGFIEHWEVEAYRRGIASARAAGRMSGRVAFVTGAAQGFGREIAEALAGDGAVVTLADLNAEGASRAAEAICAERGEGQAAAVHADVTSLDSLADALHAHVRRYGGIDLLVSNAGVLLAGSVKSQPLHEFDLVTSVNYRGFFLCVQLAAPVMARQRRACPSYWSDIIQINSKSGLAGSNRNGAYAGSKFGSIGLTQSFALELVDDGIKVNAVCPGNFFEGPLWSDPETGLFVQYLRTGKVPGARTIEDVRRAYEAKVPMGRGCTTADIMKAVYYLVEQKYETGQALPVTGGQVMLH